MRATLAVVALLAVEICAWSTPTNRQRRPRHHAVQKESALDWQSAASRAFCGMALSLGLILGNPTAFPDTNVAYAQVAPLADVGLR